MNATSNPVLISLVDQESALKEALAALQAAPSIAFDLEFDSNRHAYGLTLCLIQAATPHAAFVIDPLADLDLRPLYAILEDPDILKIVHCPGEDLRLLHHAGCHPRNVFDTEVVAKLLNMEQTSLAMLLETKLGVTLNKKEQRSNWLLRPLSPGQINYAAADVSYLHQLKDVLTHEAKEKGLSGFVADEYATLSNYRYAPAARNGFLKPADLRKMSPYDQFILSGLFAWREEEAKALNKPAYQLLNEELLRSLAAGETTPSALPNTKGLHYRLKQPFAIKKLQETIAALHAEATTQELSHEKEKKERLSPEAWSEEKERREQLERDREEKFGPIQHELRARYGEFAARYMLSNAQVQDILHGVARISTLRRPYRSRLILEIADQQGIDLSEYL